jgi:hypothetical protein
LGGDRAALGVGLICGYLAKRRDKSSLAESQTARTHRRGKAISNVIGTDIERIGKCEDDA